MQQLDLLVGDWTNLLSRRFPRLRDLICFSPYLYRAISSIGMTCRARIPVLAKLKKGVDQIILRVQLVAALAIPFESPKVAVTAYFADTDDFAARLDRAIARSHQPQLLIEQTNIELQHVVSENLPQEKSPDHEGDRGLR